jgi:hypothetical protein
MPTLDETLRDRQERLDEVHRLRPRRTALPLSIEARSSAFDLWLRRGISWCLTCLNTGSIRFSSGL